MKHKGTLLLFAYECYPYNRSASTIGAQRPYHFAKHLSDLGWKVIVLCCDQSQRRTLLKKDLHTAVDECYEKHVAALAQDSFSIVPLPSLCYGGIGDYIWSRSVTQGEGDAYVGKPFPYSFIRKIATFYNQLFHGDYSYSWVPVANLFTEKLLKDCRVDILLGEHSPDAGIILADRVSREYHIPWVADFRDPVLWPFRGFFKKIYQPVVKKIIQSSSATIAVNPYWSSLDALLFGKKTYTIVNGYDEDLVRETAAHSFSKFTVSYFGSISDTFQDVLPSIQAFADFVKQRGEQFNDVLLFYRGLHFKKFEKYCQAAGVPSHCLDIGGVVDRKETLAYMKGSAVLLIYSVPPYKAKSIYDKKGFYPGKVFEYIGAGVPMLLYPSDHGLLASLITEQSKGLACSSKEEAIFFFEEQYRLWKLGIPKTVSASADVTLYSRRNQAFQLDVLLSDLLVLPR